MLLQLSHFPPSLHSILPTPSLPHSPLYSSCPWVIHISSLASTFPILFLTSPCVFSTYHLCYLLSVPFLPLSPSHSSVDNPPCDPHFYDSVSSSSCLLSLVFVLSFLVSVVDSCEFVIFLLFVGLIFFFFLDKSL